MRQESFDFPDFRANLRRHMLRKRFITLLVLAATSLNGCVSVSTAQLPSTAFTFRKDVVYTPDGWPAPQLADIYKPTSTAPAPGILLIHGGGWSGEERRSDMAGIAKALAKRGYFVMNVTYRLTPEWKFPAQTDDLEQAIRYMRDNSKELNIDTSRLATFGYSAGGHLAALIGLDPSNGVKAIVAGGAPADISFWPNGRLTGLLLGGSLEGNEEIYRKASPVTHVTKDSPPVFIYHGTKDDLVPIEHPKAFIEVLEKKGVEHEVYWIEGRSHVFAHLFSAQAIPKSIDFLDKHLQHDRP
jgi:acetyl esterase/lipase